MDRLYTRDEYMRRIEWIKTARRHYSITTDIIVGFPGETEEDFEQTLDLLDEVQYDSLFSFKYSPRPNTAALAMDDRIPEEEKQRRLVILQEKQRAIQIRRNAELIGERAGGAGGRPEPGAGPVDRPHFRQPHVCNFHDDSRGRAASPWSGQYLPVRVTRAGPNSLVGESVTVV